MEARSDRSRSSIGAWLLISVLVIGAVASWLSIVTSRRAAADRDGRDADVAETALSAEVLQAAGALTGADGFAVDGEVTAAEFAAFAANVRDGSTLFPTLAYVAVVADDELPAFTATTGVTVKDTDGAGGFVPTASRPEHLVVRFAYPPSDIARGVIGFDIASDPIRAAAAAATARTRTPVLTRIDALATSASVGLFGIQAVRSASGQVIGYVSSGVNAGELLAIAEASELGDAAISIRIGDRLVAGSETTRGARRTFVVAGLGFELRADDRRDADLLLPVLTVGGTLLLTTGVALTLRRDRRLRLLREQATVRNRLLAELGQRLAAAVDLPAIEEEILAGAAPILGTSRVLLARRAGADRAGARTRGDGERPDEEPPDVVLVRERSAGRDRASTPSVHPLDTSAPVFDAIRLSRPVDVAAAGGTRTTVLPLTFHSGFCVGAIALEWADGEMWTPELAAPSTTFAELATRAVERAAITAATQQGAARLSTLTRSLASAATSADVARVVTTSVPAVLGCMWAELRRVDALGADSGPVHTGELPTVRWDPGATGSVDQVAVRDRAGAAIAEIHVGWRGREVDSTIAQATLSTVADLVGLTLARTDLYDQEHELITEMQNALLPPPGGVEGFDVAVRYEPASRAVGIGGDWYDVIVVGAGRVDAIIGDVSGHGAPAVTTMAQLKAVMAHLLAAGSSPSDVFAHADVMLLQQGSQATAQIARLDAAAGTLLVASAGHPYALVRRADGTVETLSAAQQPLLGVRERRGAASLAGGHDAVTVPFAPGDVLLMYTDGLIERRRSGIDERIRALAALLGGIDTSGRVDDVLGRVIGAARRDVAADDPLSDDDRAVILVRGTGLRAAAP